MDIRAATRDWCDIVWLVDPEDQTVAATRALLERSGTVVDALRAPPAQAAAAVREHGPDAIATFYDTGMEHVAEIAQELGLPFHSPEVARRLEDKLHQRHALTAAGLPSPAVAELPATLDRAGVERRASALRFPAVLKPRKASGSWHTFPVADLAELGERWDDLAARAGGSHRRGVPLRWSADAVGLRGRLRLRRDGRGRRRADAPRDHRALPAGAAVPRDRLLHPVHPAARAAGAGARPRRADAARARRTRGLHPHRDQADRGGAGGDRGQRTRRRRHPRHAGAGHRRPARAARPARAPSARSPGSSGRCRPTASPTASSASRRPARGGCAAIEGLDQVKQLPGVDRVDVHWGPGTMLDSSHGTRTYLYAVVGRAEDHAGVAAVDEFLRTRVTVEYDDA